MIYIKLHLHPFDRWESQLGTGIAQLGNEIFNMEAKGDGVENVSTIPVAEFVVI